jgi:hypothetical protein
MAKIRPDSTAGNKYEARIEENAWMRHGLSLDELMKFKYGGGRVFDDGTLSHHHYFQMLSETGEIITEMPSIEKYCLCDHAITNNCFIVNDAGDKLIVLGRCCIKRFMRNGSRRTCSTCAEPHRNTCVNRCNVCRINVCDKCGTKITGTQKICFRCK